MSLFAYAVRRMIGALVVFLLVVMLTMFAIESIGVSSRGRFESDPFPTWLNPWHEPWASFPKYAVVALGLLAVAVVLRRRLAR
jgi:hypothetical protein